jgi:hypothetical protein
MLEVTINTHINTPLKNYLQKFYFKKLHTVEELPMDKNNWQITM